VVIDTFSLTFLIDFVATFHFLDANLVHTDTQGFFLEGPSLTDMELK
jgi:hypothetical protein